MHLQITLGLAAAGWVALALLASADFSAPRDTPECTLTLSSSAHAFGEAMPQAPDHAALATLADHAARFGQEAMEQLNDAVACTQRLQEHFGERFTAANLDILRTQTRAAYGLADAPDPVAVEALDDFAKQTGDALFTWPSHLNSAAAPLSALAGTWHNFAQRAGIGVDDALAAELAAAWDADARPLTAYAAYLDAALEGWMLVHDAVTYDELEQLVWLDARRAWHQERRDRLTVLRQSYEAASARVAAAPASEIARNILAQRITEDDACLSGLVEAATRMRANIITLSRLPTIEKWDGFDAAKFTDLVMPESAGDAMPAFCAISADPRAARQAIAADPAITASGGE